uniref:uncharacterized protein LOC117607612 isoform X2 n=1 Tax=Osmia lignaria TaxID=473952 RepID=UPI00147816ED|nr:uncharacterized protein LOC117607612 isoform X2 [Osmia lignaria]
MLFRVVGMRSTWQHRRLCVYAVVCTKHLAASFRVFCEFCVVFPCEIFIGGHYKEAIIPSLNSFVTTPVSPLFIFHSSLCRSSRRSSCSSGWTRRRAMYLSWRKRELRYQRYRRRPRTRNVQMLQENR